MCKSQEISSRTIIVPSMRIHQGEYCSCSPSADEMAFGEWIGIVDALQKHLVWTECGASKFIVDCSSSRQISVNHGAIINVIIYMFNLPALRSQNRLVQPLVCAESLTWSQLALMSFKHEWFLEIFTFLEETWCEDSWYDLRSHDSLSLAPVFLLSSPSGFWLLVHGVNVADLY